MRQHYGSTFVPCWLVAALGFSALPVCVWAAPEGLREALTTAASVTHSFPEFLGAEERSPREDRPFREWVAEALTGWEDTQTGEFITPRHCVIMQAGFPTQYLLTYTCIPCEEPAFLQAASELGLPRYADHTFVPTLPQLSDGLASLVAVPKWIAATDKVIVVFDFSYWQGPVYATVDWSFITLASLAHAARKHTQAHWQVYHASSSSPIAEGGHVVADNGDVFYFVPADKEPPHRFLFTDMLQDPRLWSSCPQVVPRETTVPIWYALMSHVIRTPTYTGSSQQELQEVAADTFHNDAGDLDFEYPLEDSPLQELVYRGQLVRGVLAARLWTSRACRPGVFIFLDTRLVGLHPTFWFCSAGWVSLEHLTDGLAIRTPPGFHIAPAGVPYEEGQVLVSDRCTISLSFVETETPSASIPRPDPNAGVSGGGDVHITSNPAADLLHNSRTARQREGHHSPDPETHLRAGPRSDELVEPTRVCFQVLIPDFQTEIVEVDLTFPCPLDDALGLVEQARRSDASPYFDQLIPANPQPDVSFGTVVAFPAWQDSQRLVIVDARLLDGRFFAISVEGRLNRSSVLLHLRTPDTPGLRVYLKGVLLDNTTWYSFGQGDTLSLLPPGPALQPHVHLADMLRGAWDWVSPCPSYPGPHFPAFCVLSDGGLKVILVDVETVRSFSDFRRQTAAELQHTSGRALVSSSMPRVTNLSILGQACKALLVATEAVVRIPIPPGRIQLHRTIAFLDKRLTLRGLDWRIAERGLLDLEELVDSLQEGVPHGYVVSVTGAPTTLRLGRTFLRIANGTLLTVRYVEDAQDSEATSEHESSSHPDSGPDDESEDVRGEDSPAHNHGPSTAVDDRPRSRSRTPPRAAHDNTRQTAVTAQTECLFVAKWLGHRLCKLQPWCPARHQHELIPQDTSPGPALLLDCFRVPHYFDVGAFLAKSQGGFISSKLLGEPHPSSSAQQLAIATLRYLAPRLGQTWRYTPEPNAPHVASDSDHEVSSDASGEPASLHFAILSIGFVPEHVVVTVSLPETIATVITQLQSVRDTTSAEAFPILLPASPQPCPGSGVVLALPEWTADASCQHAFVCLDTSSIDGRIFVAASPTYVSRRHLLHLAQFINEVEVDVHFGDDPTPLSDSGQFHVASGDTFVFASVGATIPTLRALALELQDATAWSRASTFPSESTGGHLGLVHGFETMLFTTPFEWPMQYRSQIAACVGVRQQDLQLSPASPGIRNATLHGFLCRAVIAVAETTSPINAPAFGVLVDARRLHLGWRVYLAASGVVSCNKIRLELQLDSLAGWSVGIRDIPDHVDLLDVVPGQVLTASSVRRRTQTDAEPEPASAATGGHTSQISDTGIAAPVASQAPAAPVSGTTGPDTSATQGDAVSGAQPRDARRVTFAAENYRLCSFLLLGQNYLLEHVEVRLPVGISVAQAISRVSSARAPDDVLRLPMLCEVFPQPQVSHALCIATPSWETQGPIVVLDSRNINGRLFALQVGSRVDRAGLLIAAQLDSVEDIDVYIGSQPWPIPDNHFVTLFYDELVLLAQANAPHHTVASLQDMLNDEEGWISDFDPASQLSPGYNSTVWLLGNEGNRPFELQPHRRGQLRADIARLLNLSARELVLQPAHLTVPDYAYRGVAARTLLAALCRTDFADPASNPVICFIDARPIMLTITWRVCPNGVLDTQSIVEVYAGWCPPGLTLCILRHDHTYLPIGGRVVVEAGEVLTILFLPPLTQADAPDAPSSPGDDDAEDPDTSEDERADDRLADPAIVGSPAEASRASAGTGETSNTKGSQGHSWPHHTVVD